MNKFDDYLTYGFYVAGIYRVLTPRQMNDRRIIRWIKNEAVSKGVTYSKMQAFFEDYYRDAPVIFKRKCSRDGKWVECMLPTVKAFDCDRHWFEDFCVAVPMDKLPRLPRKEAKLRVWVLGCLLRSMQDQS